MDKYGQEFIDFCATHDCEEIRQKYGVAGLHKVYRERLDHPRRQFGNSSEKTINAIEDLKNGYPQYIVAKRYGISKQYVSRLHKKYVKSAQEFE